MAVKIHFEIGHTAKLKSKKTPDGFTHDWEIYVRGVDKNDISHFIEKVVFNLHDSFPKPKRVIKDAPYVLKESGYAGFMLPIDIYFRNRDEPKRVTYKYDLDLQQTGPPVHKHEIKKFVFNSPSDEFRRKLIKGGGISVSNIDEKSRDSADERSQLSNKPKLGSDASKKHKPRTDDFSTLFGTPITKTSTKVSPDPKNKPSPNVNLSINKSGKSTDKLPSSSLSSTIKDKLDKTDKKDKHKHNSPHKDKLDGISKENKKISQDDKHDRRDDKKKDKSHSKERDRSKEKNLKRPLSPTKILPSPKRASPPRSSSAASRSEENGYKVSSKTYSSNPDVISINNNSEKLSSSSASNNSSKKSKKEKKSHDKDKDREKKDKERDRKEKDERASGGNSVMIGGPSLSHPVNTNTKISTPDIKVDYSKKDKESNNSGATKDSKDIKKGPIEAKIIDTTNDKKPNDAKTDKDEKKHKHKKKDKNKEKDRDHGSKDKRRDKAGKKDDGKKLPQSQTITEPMLPPQKPSGNPLNTLMHDISEKDSSDSEIETTPASVSEKPENNTESSNSSFQEVVPTTKSTAYEDVKIEKKDRKIKDKTKIDEKKRKRKSKDDIDAPRTCRSSVSPAVNSLSEPPSKQNKKDELILKNGDKSNSPHLTLINAPTSQLLVDDTTAFRAPSSSSVPIASTSNSNHDRGLSVDYMSELRDLQQKIMTLQDNNELQQVVEMIAATGQFEVTNKTFDFDLCALDRLTVQRLQDFFATSCS